MQIITASAAPDAHILDSYRNSGATLPDCICELIDNSFDAGAIKVEITMSSDQITVKDNGLGTPHIEDMVKLGGHRASSTTSVGKYGVGGKGTAITIGERYQVRSVFNGVSRFVDIMWKNLANNGWEFEIETGETKDKCGTTVSILKPVISSVLPKPTTDRISRDFQPALTSGRSVTINGKKVVPVVFPKFKELHTAEGEDVFDDCLLKYKVEFGEMLEVYKGEPFLISYGHRIMFDTSEPCGELSPTSRFRARVMLSGKGWGLLKHKDGLRECESTRWLYKQLNQDCHEVMKRLHDSGENVEMKEAEHILESIIADIHGQARRPGKPEQPTDKTGRKRPRKIKEAEVTGGFGIVRQRRERGAEARGVNIRRDEVQPEDSLGKIQSNKTHITMILNKNHPTVIGAKPDTILTLALSLYAAHLISDPDRQLKLPGLDEEKPNFGQIYGAMLISRQKMQAKK